MGAGGQFGRSRNRMGAIREAADAGDRLRVTQFIEANGADFQSGSDVPEAHPAIRAAAQYAC